MKFSKGQNQSIQFTEELVQDHVNLSASYEMIFHQLKTADSMIETLCGEDKNCISKYKKQKDLALESDKPAIKDRLAKLSERFSRYKLNT
jgi:hypothetical protein